MIVVTLTSWIKRINTVKKIIESIMNNTVKPDRLYLNLSKTEFDGIELPKDLVEYFDSDERLIINWVEGEDTKSMKKVFPILQYLKDDDIIITADDDIMFPKDLIESRINDFNKYGKKFSVTSNKNLSGLFPKMYIASAVSLYTKKMLNNWNRYVNDEIIKTYNDDRTYLYILWFNGYLNAPCTKYNLKELLRKYDLKLNESSMRLNHVHLIASNYDAVANRRLKKMSNLTSLNMKGFFNKKVHDCVLVYEMTGVDSKVMTCGEHLEIEYVIASLKKFCSSWCGRIFVVGSEPPNAIKNDVIHIPCDNPYTHCKDANIIHKLRYACEHIPDLSDDFLMISDDQIVTKESSWEDMTPRIVRMYKEKNEAWWNENRRIDFWHECLYQTMKLFPKDTCCFWEPHIWSPMNKYKFIEMCNKYDYAHNIGCISQSLYYNYVNQKPVRNFDHTHLLDGNAYRVLSKLNVSNVCRHLSWADRAFSRPEFRHLLNTIVGFPEGNKPVVKPKPKKEISRIKSLRDDIANGNVIKVSVNGGFIWKRIK